MVLLEIPLLKRKTKDFDYYQNLRHFTKNRFLHDWILFTINSLKLVMWQNFLLIPIEELNERCGIIDISEDKNKIKELF